jgi:hypothetical protein
MSSSAWKFDFSGEASRNDAQRPRTVTASASESLAEPLSDYEHPLFSVGIPKDFDRNPVLNALVNIDEYSSGGEAPAPRAAHGGRVEKGVAGHS